MLDASAFAVEDDVVSVLSSTRVLR